MKKRFFILLLIIFSQFSYGQTFNIRAETQYLNLILRQNRKDLIKDNLRNAELVADTLFITNKVSAEDVANFFINLSENYFYLKKYDFAAFSILRYRCLFPFERFQKRSREIFLISLHKIGKNKKFADSLWNLTADNTVKVLSENKRKELLLKTAMMIETKKISGKIYNYTIMYENSTLGSQIPFYIAQWELFYNLKISPKKRTQMINFNNENPDYTLQDLTADLKNKQKKCIKLRMKLFGSY